MIQPEYQVYDFRAASKVERPLSAALKIWQTRFAQLFVERWQDFAPAAIQVTPSLITAMSFEKAQSRWGQSAMGVPINVKDNSVQGMLVAQRADLIILMMEILSESLTERPADRELTAIEVSLSQLLFQHTITTFGDAWPDKDAMPIKLKELDFEPHRGRMFPPQKEVLVMGFSVRTVDGSNAEPARFEWIFAKEELRKLLGVNVAAPVANDGIRIPVENIAPIMVNLSARLGAVELQMSELIALGEGDIVKLNQRIMSPLTLFVNEQPSLRAWPGRSGDQRCLMIDS